MAGGPGGQLIGKLRVKVVPDTSGFSGELKRDLAGVNEDETVVVGVKINMADLKAAQAVLANAFDNQVVFIKPVVLPSSGGGVAPPGDGNGAPPAAPDAPSPGGGGGRGIDLNLPKLKEAQGYVKEIERALQRIGGPIAQGGAIVTGVAAIAALMSPIVGAVSALPALLLTIIAPIGLIALGFDGVKAAFAELSPAFADARDKLNEMNERNFAPLVTALNSLTPILEGSITRLGGALGVIVEAIAGFIANNTSEIDVLFANLAVAMEALAPFIGVVLELLLQMLNFVLPLIPGLLAALTTGLTIMGEEFEKIAPLIARAIDDFGQFVQGFLIALPIIIAVFVGLGEGARSFFSVIGTVMTGVVRFITGMVAPIQSALAAVTGAFRNAGGGIDGVMAAIRAAFSAAVGIVIAAGAGLVAFMIELAATIITQILRVTSLFTSVGQSWPASMRTAAAGVRSAVANLPQQIVSIFSGLGSTLNGIGSDIMSGLLSGITSGFGAIQAAFSRLTSLIPSWKGPQQRDLHLLDDAADDIMGGFTKKIESNFGNVRATFGAVPIDVAPSGRQSAAGVQQTFMVDPRADGGFVEEIATQTQRAASRALNLRFSRV